MVQGNRDFKQDVDDIVATRDELTEKVELLRGRIQGRLWHTKHEIGRSMEAVKEAVDGVRHILNPSYQLRGHPVAIVAVIITLRYFLRQWRKRGSPTRRNRAHAMRRDLR